MEGTIICNKRIKIENEDRINLVAYSFRLESELLEDFKELAILEDESVGWIMRTILNDYMKYYKYIKSTKDEIH